MFPATSYAALFGQAKIRRCAAAALIAIVGCSTGPARIHPPEIDADDAGEQAVALYDQDGDEMLSTAELEKCPAILGRIDRYDADQDGQVSASEIAGRIKQLREMRVALMPLGVTVTFNGRPLADAHVEFIPESFLGEAVLPAAGTTDRYGTVKPAIDAEKLPDDLADIRGVHLGLYQVKITHPEKQLGEQVLGTEVDHTDNWQGLRFDLKSN